jgi:hypothetical protein
LEKKFDYKLDLVGVQEVRWAEVAPNQHANLCFSMEEGMKIINEVQVVSYINESYQKFC